MFEQVIKQRSKSGFEEGPEAGSVGGNGLVCQQGGQEMLPYLIDVPVDSLVHLRIKAKLITKVLKEQAFVVARSRGDGIDTCAIEPVFREYLFCCVKNRLPRPLGIMDSSSSTSRFSRFRHTLLISFSI